MTERRAATRRRLLDAASAVVAERGFHAASGDAIADEAGYSVGAIYSNFGGKDDLFLAVFDEHLAWFESVVTDPAPGSSAVDALLAEEQQFLVFIEFWSYAVRSPKVKRRLAQRMGRLREHVRDLVDQRAREQGLELTADAGHVALLMLALVRGIAIERLADRKSVPDGLLAGALDAVVASATR